jgi:hypothetical protein
MQDSNLIGESSKMQQTMAKFGDPCHIDIPAWTAWTSWAPQQRFPSASAATSLHRKDAARGSVGNPPATQAWRSSDVSGETKAAKSKGTCMAGWIHNDLCGLSGDLWRCMWIEWLSMTYRCGCAFVCKMSRDRFIFQTRKSTNSYHPPPPRRHVKRIQHIRTHVGTKIRT